MEVQEATAEQNSSNTAENVGNSVEEVSTNDTLLNTNEDTSSTSEGQENDSTLLGVADEEGKDGESGQSEPEIDADALTIADDSPINEADKNGLLEFAKQHGLNQDMAQATLDLIANTKTRVADELQSTQQEEYKKQVEGWKSEIASDKDLGGDNLSATDKNATQVLIKFWGEDFMKEIQSNGIGAYPKFIRGLVAVHKALSPDVLQQGESANAMAELSPQDILDVRFPPDMLK